MHDGFYFVFPQRLDERFAIIQIGVNGGDAQDPDNLAMPACGRRP